jgi:hypothetical protein
MLERRPIAGLFGQSFCHSPSLQGMGVSPLTKGGIHLGEEIQMQKLLSVIVAVGLAVAFAGPGFAASKVPTTKAGCVKAHMKWDESTKTCSKM